MITVYGRATSSNVQAVMWGIAELGLACERLDYGHVYGGTDTPEFRAMNPNGLVPVLRDGDARAVRELRDPALPRQPLRPVPVLAGGPGRPRADRRLGGVGQDHAAARLHRPGLLGRDPHPRRRGDRPRSPAALEVHERNLDDPRGAARRRALWLLGPDFTLADIVVGHVALPLLHHRDPAARSPRARRLLRPA